MILRATLARGTYTSLLKKSKACFSGVARVLKDSDSLSQSDIDSILGNEPSEIEPINESNQLATQLFYNLVPVKNVNFPPCIDPYEEYILDTPNQNIMNALGITVQSSYDDYCKGLQMYRREDQLYGSISEPSEIIPEQLPFRHVLTHDSKYLDLLRRTFVVNLSIPGSIQAEDPRNFMELRPVQEFRNTPIIPIAESTMRKHKQKLEEYHRRQFVFEIKKESVVNFGMFMVAGGICGYMIYYAMQKEEERTIAYTRFKYNRTMGIDETPTFKI